MKYAAPTGLDRARNRRQRQSSIILIVVAALVLAGFIYAIGYAAGVVPGSALPSVPASCKPSSPPPLPQAASRLNVYNASSDQGQAQTVANAMKSRGFKVAVVSNDPYKMTIDGVGQIRFGPSGAEFAKKFVQPLAPGASLSQDGRTDSSVDLVLGKAFVPVPTASASSTSAATTPPGC